MNSLQPCSIVFQKVKFTVFMTTHVFVHRNMCTLIGNQTGFEVGGCCVLLVLGRSDMMFDNLQFSSLLLL